MKREILFIASLLWSYSGNAFATEIMDPECTAKAQVLDITSKKYEAAVYGDVHEIFYAPFKIIETDCPFLKKDEVYDTTGNGGNNEKMKKGMVVSAGVAQNAAMSPSGAIYFLDWRPIKILSPEAREMPEDYLRTSERVPLNPAPAPSGAPATTKSPAPAPQAAPK